ncbi:MAG: hypothetical protein KDJ72_00500 [Methyloceanibacter sp.]|uniref:ATP-binding protein n=1 Tax=Methyloceanibacter sp. TaxID=1965321 RepID=UPI001D3788F0|nr:ATP-binding protein [Methyloceanibacter sp.]MCB1441475.1 hypothetical protein [Methyloceanibacter sp.]
MTDLRLQQRIGHSDREALEHIARALEGRLLPGAAADASSTVNGEANGLETAGAGKSAAPDCPGLALGPAGVESLIEAMPAAIGILKGDALLTLNSAFAYAFGYRSPAELLEAGGLDTVLPGGAADLRAEAPDGRIADIAALTRSRRRLTATFLLATLDDDAGLRLLRLIDPSDREPEPRAPEPMEPPRRECEPPAPEPVDRPLLESAPPAPEPDVEMKASILSLTLVPPVTPVPAAGSAAAAEPEDRNSPADHEAPKDASLATREDGTKPAEPRQRDREAAARQLDFLAKVSHEVRTPLNSIIGFAELMLHERFGPVGNARYKGYAEDIHQSGLYALSLLNDLLDISKIEAGKFELDFTAVDVAEVVESCVASLQPLAKRTRIVLRTSFADDLPLVVADPRRLRQIMLNLLTNAIKFTKEGGQVIASGTMVDGDLRLRVHDSGVGMSKNDITYAMQPFHQLDTAPRHQSGTGLGLPLTKALTDAIRARLELTSEPGVGTSADVIFPNDRLSRT